MPVSSKPEGEPVGLYIDLPYEHPDSPAAGDWIATDAGSRYLITRVHRVVPRLAKNQHRRRYQLSCVRLAKHAEIPTDITAWWLNWYPRDPRRLAGE